MVDIGAPIAFGVSAFVIFIIVIVACCTCSCCCLYNACRNEPRPVVIPTTTTTVVQVPCRQPQGAVQMYPTGYQPVPVQLGYINPPVPSAPYPTQHYLPPHFSGPPPPYQETVPVAMGMPVYDPARPSYHPDQPAFNPAYGDPSKSS
ncbi:protein shisa-5-like [Erpetoichthys calabaricus]|uniref:Protein shisa-5-like n=1 Tax=Erpetoichthys calabaricus TaxID=27687 RepID=A0A8C4T952_ERPCA|nr:protein shisa-5-like [Erpetoichthys calabaricus]